MSKILLSTAYLPNIQYFRALAQNESAEVEVWETFPKQSFRNRCQIQTQAGVMSLSIPLVKVNSKHLTKDIKISYTDSWQSKHWHAITSTYNSSPYFEYYRDEFEIYYTRHFDYLLDFNNQIVATIMKILNIKTKIVATTDYVREFQVQDNYIADLRNVIHPKQYQKVGQNYYSESIYPQVFDSRMAFLPNLSIIDMIFNIGEETISYLK